MNELIVNTTFGVLDWHPEHLGEKGNLIDARWSLNGSPAPVMLARKMFSHTVCRSPGKVSWPDWHTSFEDLKTLVDRYPLEMTMQAAEAWEKHQKLLDRRKNALVQHNGIFKGDLRPFQVEGVQFVMSSRKCLVGDDTGLGKTVEALASIAEIDEWPVVIVCQSHVQRHWEKKIVEFLDAADANDITLLDQGKKTYNVLRGARAKIKTKEADIYLVHYLVLHGWTKWLKEKGVRAVYFDECQELRNVGTRKHNSCETIARSVHTSVGLSATPIYGRGPEMFNVMNTLNRGCLGTRTEFQDLWCETDALGKMIVSDPNMLGQYLRDRELMIRRTKEDVRLEIPPKQRSIEQISADNQLFHDLVQEAVALAHEAETTSSPFDRGRLEQEAINQTRKATGIAKVPAIIPFLHAMMEAEEPTLVFAHHHAVHDAIKAAMVDFNPVSITGADSTAQKDRAQEMFQSGQSNLCIIALRAATGLDGLQERARIVTHCELDWSPAVHYQAEDRAYRWGQRNPVISYYLVADVGSDPYILQTLGVKSAQLEGINQDRPPSEEEIRAAAAAAEDHKASILNMLKGL